MSPGTVLITGASRGIGLEFAKQMSKAGWEVIATCRHPEKAEQLSKVEGIQVEELDVTSQEQVQALREKLKERSIDMILNNAGIKAKQGCGSAEISGENIKAVWEVNVQGVGNVTKAFLPNVHKSGKRLVVAIGSGYGLIGENDSGGSTAYRMSKAGLMKMMRGWSMQETAQKVKYITLLPGWVETDMGGPNARLKVDHCVGMLLAVLQNHEQMESGSLYDYNGTNIGQLKGF